MVWHGGDPKILRYGLLHLPYGAYVGNWPIIKIILINININKQANAFTLWSLCGQLARQAHYLKSKEYLPVAHDLRLDGFYGLQLGHRHDRVHGHHRRFDAHIACAATPKYLFIN